jgi:recombinational DNA repair ATPase RecF
MTTREAFRVNAQALSDETVVSQEYSGQSQFISGARKGAQRQRVRRSPRGQQQQPSGQIQVVIQQAKDGNWVADDPETGQFGVGASADEAVRDLLTTLLEYRDVLRTRRHSLSSSLAVHLRLLERRFAEDG